VAPFAAHAASHGGLAIALRSSPIETIPGDPVPRLTTVVPLLAFPAFEYSIKYALFVLSFIENGTRV
jgi:hypothetical protein